MNRNSDFIKYREQYPEFRYNSYNIQNHETEIEVDFYFEIVGLAQFRHNLRLPKKSLPIRSLNSPAELEIIENLVFQIGLAELISYWKLTCSPKVVIACGELNTEQIAWWKKLYYYGLGELFYTNGIKTSLEDFMQITSEYEGPDRTAVVPTSSDHFDGYMVTVGGGKDSNVTLEVLDVDPARDFCFIMNPKPVTRECARLAGFNDDRVIELYRKLDPQIVELNQQGFINGHVPFSAVLAFITYFVAYLVKQKYIVVSNESSANESNLACAVDPDLACAKVNHQYSKSFEFEQDFTSYAAQYLRQPITYFSFLRPLNELQIAKIFARLEKYHPVFKSCNVGSKGPEWVWCGHCAKCLFAFIILAPYLYPDKLIKIFDKDLFADETLLPIFLELIGQADNKPFDCVGTFAEVNFAVSQTIHSLQETGQKLPYLLQYYLDHYGLVDLSDDLTQHYNVEHNLTPEQDALLRSEVFRDR